MEGALQAEQLGLAINFDLVNQEVLDFAGQFTNEWWERTASTTRDAMRTAIRNNISTGAPLSSLEKSLEPLFGRGRAQVIASTETTRMFAEGNRRGYKSAGIKTVKFQTVRDSRVDPICDALQGQELDINDTSRFPPLHPRCRCWIAPITAEGAALTRIETFGEVPQSIETQARGLLSSARKAEPSVTKALNKVVKKYDGKLLGKEFAVKTEKSLLRKMNELVKSGTDPGVVGAGINDSLRYTMQFSKSAYAKSSQAALVDLQAAGYRVSKIKNYWATPDGYRGLNTVLTSPTGKRFEIQFHTQFSHRIKEANHITYDQIRVMDDGLARQALEKEMDTLFATVPVPPGTPEMTWADVGFEQIEKGMWEWI